MSNTTENRGRKLGSKVRKNVLTIAQLTDGTLPNHMPIAVSKGVMETYNLLKKTYSQPEIEQADDDDLLNLEAEAEAEAEVEAEVDAKKQEVEADFVATDSQETVRGESEKTKAKVKVKK